MMDKKIPYHDLILTSRITPPSRDPFILRVGNTYYAYASTWTVCHSLTDSLAGPFTEPRVCVENPADYLENQWAPEVYARDGRYYMITTYKSTKTNHRGCGVFVSDSPEGPFRLASDGHVTPAEWDSIDGTLYIDEEGQPWMVFVHEWTCTEDSIGRMACARLSPDLTRFVSEPVELFRADDPDWSTRGVTDGCFLYRTTGGKLLMLWSNWDAKGYCVGVAESESGRVTGPWRHHSKRLFSKEMTGEYDGGHGMLFTDTKGRLWMSLHSPNDPRDGRDETAVFVPLRDTGDDLVWDTAPRSLV